MDNAINSNNDSTFKLNWIWTGVIWGIIVLSMAMDQFILLGIPLAGLAAYAIIRDYRLLYYAFFIIIPFSVEVYLPNGLGTDLPSEPVMWLMTGLSLFLLIGKKWRPSGIKKFNNPITWILLFHIGWIILSVITASDTVRSFKFLLAKLWYVIPFYFLSLHIIKDRGTLVKVIKLCMYSLTIAMIYVFINHLLVGFTFKSSNDVVQPIFRNHVNYAAMLVLFLPYVVGLRYLSPRYKWLYNVLIAFFLVCIYLSFTRAAILSVVIASGAFFIIKYRLVEKVLLISVVAAVLGLGYLSTNNNYLKLAPDFEKTITHSKFDNLIEATYKMEDISTMERLYRWVAGFEMVSDRPWSGFGPNNFYVNYNKYTVSAFQTYVSDNPDHSGIHNYYLMTAVDQGIFGLLLFVLMISIVLIIGQRVFHQLKDQRDRIVLVSSLCSFIVILSLNLINDIIEVDKIGPFFFFSMAVVAFYKYKSIPDQDVKLDS